MAHNTGRKHTDLIASLTAEVKEVLEKKMTRMETDVTGWDLRLTSNQLWSQRLKLKELVCLLQQSFKSVTGHKTSSGCCLSHHKIITKIQCLEPKMGTKVWWEIPKTPGENPLMFLRHWSIDRQQLLESHSFLQLSFKNSGGSGEDQHHGCIWSTMVKILVISFQMYYPPSLILEQ